MFSKLFMLHPFQFVIVHTALHDHGWIIDAFQLDVVSFMDSYNFEAVAFVGVVVWNVVAFEDLASKADLHTDADVDCFHVL